MINIKESTNGEKLGNKIFTINLSTTDNDINNNNINNNADNNEIFKDEEEIAKKYSSFDYSISWVKAHFFFSDQRLLFGTWDGVFSSILLNLFGVVIFTRAGWMVASNKK
jgi:hypothetical protein